ncbi:hypothetical protein TNCV_5005021 [Trichonephila clavipes]|uniref:Uncharacterized protein n=1 Tax=Trichonephila clavipes TaxID=2585209 RepID=A0A8X6UY15_TRICX|nr:hypothetical protein TNCV_5005021 [Trichonephila clavipes]
MPFLSIYAEWTNDSRISSRHQAAGSPCIKEKEHQETVLLSKAKLVPAQYNAGSSTSVSEHTVQWTLLDMGFNS